MLEKLLGNPALVADLSAALAAGRLPHGILLCGMEGLGKNFAARAIAADYLYPAGGPGADRVMAGANEEVLTVAPEGAGNEVRVDAIRQLRSRIGESSLLTEGRVGIVYEAHRMKAPASNALLKTLEEPPAGAVLILTADSEASLLPTIRSRCAVYTLSPLSVYDCARQLAERGVDRKAAELLCAVYGGALGSCLAGAGKERQRALAVAVEAANAGQKQDAYALLRLTAPLLQKKDRAVLVQFITDLSDVLAAALGSTAVPGLSVDAFAAARMLPVCRAARSGLLANGNQKLLMTLFAAQLAGQCETPA